MITAIGDDFIKNLAGISDSLVIQNFGKISSWQLMHLIKQGKVDLEYPLIFVVVGGHQVMSEPAEKIVDGIKEVILKLRARASESWVAISTLLYQPRDETLSKIKIDLVNNRIREAVQDLSKVGCRCVLVRAHHALVSPVDNKLLRPIHVYFENGLIPSKQAAYLLVRYFVACALEILIV